jgi:hypothetical protein
MTTGPGAVLSSAASPNQIFYDTKVDGEDHGPQVIKFITHMRYA